MYFLGVPGVNGIYIYTYIFSFFLEGYKKVEILKRMVDFVEHFRSDILGVLQALLFVKFPDLMKE